MIYSRILGTGSCLPEQILDNNYLSTLVDTNDEWIQERTGIRSRRIAVSETTASMALHAAQKAVEDAGIAPEDIDLIIAATFTPDFSMPGTACMVQAGLLAGNAFCFDLNAACTGFLYALQTAHAYIRSGMCRNVLVIGSETVSRTIDWTDRGTCILFGDGAGAAILSQSDMPGGILDFVSGSDGGRGMVLNLENRPLKNPLRKEDTAQPYLKMDGQEVFKFAVRKVPETILEITRKNNLAAADIKHYLLHQANKRILQAVAKRLKTDECRFPMNLHRYGNTSAASIPILLDEVCRSGQVKPGDYMILSGFGGGLTWGTALIRW